MFWHDFCDGFSYANFLDYFIKFKKKIWESELQKMKSVPKKKSVCKIVHLHIISFLIVDFIDNNALKKS